MSPAWMRMLLPLALGVILLFSSFALAKAPPAHRPIRLSSELPVVKVGDYAAMLVDPEGTLNLPEVKHAYAQGQFQKTQSDLDFGFTRDAVWLRVVLENPGDKDTAYVLDTSYHSSTTSSTMNSIKQVHSYESDFWETNSPFMTEIS